MKIAGYKLEYGEWYPPSIKRYIHARVDSLGRKVAKELGDAYEVRVRGSFESESAYIRIRHRELDISYTISFRNHGQFKAKYDRQVLLSKFDTWKQCKAFFMDVLLRDCIEALMSDKALEKEIRRALLMELNKAEVAAKVYEELSAGVAEVACAIERKDRRK